MTLLLRRNVYSRAVRSSRRVVPHRWTRTLFALSNEPKSFHERKIFPYSKEQLYAIVSDVSSYPEFIPHCVGSRIIRSTEDARSGEKKMEAELTVGFLAFRESYVSRVTCVPYESVEAKALSSTPLFKQLSTVWRFQNASPNSPHPSSLPPLSVSNSNEDPTLVTLDLVYGFANPLHASVSEKFFGKVSKKMVQAFEERCVKVYGAGRR